MEALDLPGFTAVEADPWLVVGDEPAARVASRVETVGWATAALRHQFDFADPEAVWTIWLFADDASYRHHARVLFDDEPTTPYGYATADHNALVMNIATGGGTMIHEMVHPMLHASFPAVPAWFNEGLASLYEQCSADGEGIRGELNWRLPGLQKGIAEGWLPPLSWLMSLDAHTFYSEDPGTNYGQARYLLYYLQQHGLLLEYYAAIKAQPEGTTALQAVLGVPSVADWERDVWRPYVLSLRE